MVFLACKYHSILASEAFPCMVALHQFLRPQDFETFQTTHRFCRRGSSYGSPFHNCNVRIQLYELRLSFPLPSSYRYNIPCFILSHLSRALFTKLKVFINVIKLFYHPVSPPAQFTILPQVAEKIKIFLNLVGTALGRSALGGLRFAPIRLSLRFTGPSWQTGWGFPFAQGARVSAFRSQISEKIVHFC